jgi:hypothetical protein
VARLKNRNQKEISPCIASKVKHALGVKNRFSGNNTTCSEQKWFEVCELLGNMNGCSKLKIETAKTRYSIYAKSKVS